MKKISLPKIGIRPVIDGRRMGVRESLEEQTMNMAKATAALLTEKLRHACGAAVECVISDTCIAGMAEAAACEEKFSSQNVTALNVPALFTWQRLWQLTARKASRHSPFTVMTFRMPMTHRFLPMLKRNCCALPAPV